LNRYRDGAISAYSAAEELREGVVLSLAVDGQGRLWAGTLIGPVYWTGSRFIRVAPPSGSNWSQMLALQAGPRGDVYAVDNRLGLVEIRDGKASRISLPGVEAKNIYRLKAARSGAIWVGFFSGGVAEVSDGEVHSFTPQQGVPKGPVQAIYE